MKRPLSRLVVVPAVWVLVWCPAAWAQEQEQKQAQAQAQEPELPVIELTFDGGTVGEYVEALRNAVQGANVVVTTPEVQELVLPPVQLDSVDLGAAVHLIEGDYQPNERTVIRIEVDVIGRWHDDQKPVFKVSGQVRRRGPAAAESGVWTVADLLASDVPPEAVLTAVETALELFADNRARAEVRFHEETGLLIARGDPLQMEAIDDVVDRLREGLDRRREVKQQEAGQEAEEKASQRVKELENELRGRMLEIERMAVRCDVIQKERERLEVERHELQNVLREHQAVIRELQARAQ